MARGNGQTPEYYVTFHKPNESGFGGMRMFYAGQEAELEIYLSGLRESGYSYEVQNHKKETIFTKTYDILEDWGSSLGDVAPKALENIGRGIGNGINAVFTPIIKGITSPLIVPALVTGGVLVLLLLLLKR